MRVLTSIRLTQFGGLSVRQASKMVRPRSVTGDGEGLVSRGGLVWLGEVADHDGQIGRDFGRPGPGCFMMRPARANKPDGLPSRLVPHRHRPRAELQPAHEL